MLLVLVVWSARAWLSSEKVIPRERMRTAVVERGPFVRDVAATGLVVAAVSPTLFAEAPGTIIYKVRAGDAVKAGDVLGMVESAALTNEYDRERATLAERRRRPQPPDHRSPAPRSSRAARTATSPRCRSPPPNASSSAPRMPGAST